MSRRLTSLDVLRGLTVAGMILVNNQGSTHHFPGTSHAKWHGVTPADLVFPFFLLIVGSSMAMSFARRPSHLRILRRAALLVGLGILVNAVPDFDWGHVYPLGVLQRIGIAYLLAALVVLHVPRRGQFALAGGILVGYWVALGLVPFPGHAVGHLLPQSNLVAHVDRLLFGVHAPQVGTAAEGALSTLPAVVTVLLGYWAGQWLRSQPVSSLTARRLAGAGAVCATVGAVWHPLLPLNKQLWTSSFVLFSGGLGLLLLAATYELIEVRELRVVGRPFEVLGLNALFVFLITEEAARLVKRVHVGDVTLRAWLDQRLFVPWSGEIGGSLAFALTVVALCWLLLFAMYRRRWFIRL